MAFQGTFMSRFWTVCKITLYWLRAIFKWKFGVALADE